MTNDPQAEGVLEYWLGARNGDEWGKFRKQWFRGGPAVDDEIRARFGELHTRARAGELDEWQRSAEGSLALVIVLDQFSRNLHRGTADAFAADPKALALAKAAVAAGFDQQVLPMHRWFFYLPFEHSEALADQQRSLELFGALPEEGGREIGLDYARQHFEIVERFGRFPHRNEILARESTPEETAWLAAGGTRFG